MTAEENCFFNGINTCLSFLNEVKNLAKDTGIKYAFSDYPMPDFSLPLTIYFSFVIIPVLFVDQE